MESESTGSQFVQSDRSTTAGPSTSVPAPGRRLNRGGGNNSGEAYVDTLVTADSQSTGVGYAPASRRRLVQLQAPIARNIQLRCRAIIEACVDDLNRAIDNSADVFSRSNALEQLKRKLSDLWHTRKEREESFAEAVNMFQAIFIERRVEDFSRQQLECVRAALEKLQQESLFDDEIVNGITVELLNGGIDVFREID